MGRKNVIIESKKSSRIQEITKKDFRTVEQKLTHRILILPINKNNEKPKRSKLTSRSKSL